MITTIRAIMLKVEPALFTRATHLVGREARQPWINIRKTVSKNVWYAVGV